MYYTIFLICKNEKKIENEENFQKEKEENLMFTVNLRYNVINNIKQN